MSKISSCLTFQPVQRIQQKPIVAGHNRRTAPKYHTRPPPPAPPPPFSPLCASQSHLFQPWPLRAHPPVAVEYSPTQLPWTTHAWCMVEGGLSLSRRAGLLVIFLCSTFCTCETFPPPPAAGA
jgi:hypothetical protein